MVSTTVSRIKILNTLPSVLPSISLKNIVLHPKLAVHNLHLTIVSNANLTRQVFLLTGTIPSTMEQIPNWGENFAWDVLKTVTGDVISKVLVVLALIIYARLITGRWPLALIFSTISTPSYRTRRPRASAARYGPTDSSLPRARELSSPGNPTELEKHRYTRDAIM
ncbi:hypothetical protein TWF217_000601 [Orbilia oligospora]|nr:hypothetical protein TWF217_000601 [Orbilia oligospora]